jgi:DNA-binding YbaB/EbfC family protein
MKLPKGFGNQGYGGYLDQMKSAMSRAQNLEAELADERIEIDKGPVKATFDGTGGIVSIKLDPSVVDPEDIEALEDLIVATVADGFKTATEMRAAKMQEILPNMPDIPGLNF